MGLKAPLGWQEQTEQWDNAGQWVPQVPKDRQETSERTEKTEMLAHQELPEQTGNQDLLGLTGPLAQQERTDKQGQPGQWDPQVPKDPQETTEKQERTEIMAQQECPEQTDYQD